MRKSLCKQLSQTGCAEGQGRGGSRNLEEAENERKKEEKEWRRDRPKKIEREMNLQCAAILELLAGEDETLLVWWDALLVLDLGLHGIDGIGSLDLECDGLAGQCLYEDLHVGNADV